MWRFFTSVAAPVEPTNGNRHLFFLRLTRDKEVGLVNTLATASLPTCARPFPLHFVRWRLSTAFIILVPAISVFVPVPTLSIDPEESEKSDEACALLESEEGAGGERSLMIVAGGWPIRTISFVLGLESNCEDVEDDGNGGGSDDGGGSVVVASVASAGKG